MINVITKVLKQRLNILIGQKFALIKHKPFFFKIIDWSKKRYLFSEKLSKNIFEVLKFKILIFSRK